MPGSRGLQAFDIPKPIAIVYYVVRHIAEPIGGQFRSQDALITAHMVACSHCIYYLGLLTLNNPKPQNPKLRRFRVLGFRI